MGVVPTNQRMVLMAGGRYENNTRTGVTGHGHRNTSITCNRSTGMSREGDFGGSIEVRGVEESNGGQIINKNRLFGCNGEGFPC